MFFNFGFFYTFLHNPFNLLIEKKKSNIEEKEKRIIYTTTIFIQLLKEKSLENYNQL